MSHLNSPLTIKSTERGTKKTSNNGGTKHRATTTQSLSRLDSLLTHIRTQRGTTTTSSLRPRRRFTFDYHNNRAQDKDYIMFVPSILMRSLT